MPYTESDYEDTVLQLFTQTLGYAYVYGRRWSGRSNEDGAPPKIATLVL